MRDYILEIVSTVIKNIFVTFVGVCVGIILIASYVCGLQFIIPLAKLVILAWLVTEVLLYIIPSITKFIKKN